MISWASFHSSLCWALSIWKITLFSFMNLFTSKIPSIFSLLFLFGTLVIQMLDVLKWSSRFFSLKNPFLSYISSLFVLISGKFPQFYIPHYVLIFKNFMLSYIYFLIFIYYSLNIPFLQKTFILVGMDSISFLISEYIKGIFALSERFLV